MEGDVDMKASSYPGKLIVIEGLDGAGTTTQAALLYQWVISELGKPACLTAEPSRGPIGALIRSVLNKRLTMDPITLAGMYASDRLDHLYNSHDGIIHHLKNGEWVILDRYYLSSFAYQASQMSEPQRLWLKMIHQPCLMPDITLFLDVPADICLERIAINRNKQFELFEKKSMLRTVEKQYKTAMQAFQEQGEIITIIDGLLPIEEVQSAMRSIISSMFLI
jgi:dTMP kinase